MILTKSVQGLYKISIIYKIFEHFSKSMSFMVVNYLDPPIHHYCIE